MVYSTDITELIPYRVRIIDDALAVRSGAGAEYDVIDTIQNIGVYKVVKEAMGSDASMWGLLEANGGWISLDYAEKI